MGNKEVKKIRKTTTFTHVNLACYCYIMPILAVCALFVHCLCIVCALFVHCLCMHVGACISECVWVHVGFCVFLHEARCMSVCAC